MLPPSVRSRLSAAGNAYVFEHPDLVDRAAARLRRPLDRAFLRRVTAFADLERLGDVVRREAPPATGPHVLLVALRGWPDHNAFEAVVAAALRMRGARVTLLTCGGGLPLCEMGWGRRAWPRPCDRCAPHTAGVAERLGLEHERLADLLPWGGDGRRAPSPTEVSADAVEISRAWILRTSVPGDAPDGAAVGTDLQAGVDGVAGVAEELLDRLRPDVLFTVNGLFSAEHALREAAKARGIRCPTYEISPRAGALAFSQEAPAPEYDTDHAWSVCRDRPLEPEQRAAVTGLLDDRASGRGAHESYFTSVEDDHERLRAAVGIPPGARLASLFTNLTWDSAALGRDVGFAGMMDFIERAVRGVAAIDGMHLVIRIHPAETRWRTRETVEAALLERLGGVLPATAHVIGPDQPLGSYALLDASDLVLGYTTTIGLEAATAGFPVLVGGDVHYRGRGFTYDVEGPDDLTRLLADPPGRLNDEQRELALRYAFTFFYRGFVPLRSVTVQAGKVSAIDATPERLRPGGDAHLDWVADRLLDGEDLLLPDELALA
ncbi:hypothetical protein [Patulibacter sp.]|uniref:hypothetical protein n=1 Tax=Patulibacter sp. TaxID=1912859 RepID=UPI002728EDE9|nr:hypothetical protein [Patulibacter sp.]MDO9408796.1 hypothetical protein [Patulibacter sp.]